MTLPPLFPSRDPSRTQFALTDGLGAKNLPEPGFVYNGELHDAAVANYDAGVQITDLEPTGTFNSTATWTLTITPTTTPWGSAAADGMGTAYVQYVASAKTKAQVVAGLIAAATTSVTPTTLAAAAAYNRFRAYVGCVEGATNEKIRLTSVTAGQGFLIAISSTTAGDSGTETAIETVSTATVKVGLYYAINRNKGTNGYDSNGKVHLTVVGPSTVVADIVGPIENGSGTNALSPGYCYREFAPGSVVPYTRYGCVTAYTEAAVATAGVPVYVRHTVDSTGDYIPGLAADATRAAVGATAGIWTGTPAETNGALYSMNVVFGLATVAVNYTGDGSAADTEVVAGLKVELAKYTAAGQPLYGITTSGTDTLILTGPADGRDFTVATPATSAGAITWVETEAAVSTHTLLTRGDKFVATTTRIGSAPVAVPHV
jgi:hypothetical protein